MMRRHPGLRRVEVLSAQEIEAALRAGFTNVAELAARLRVPRESLRRRLEELRMTRRPAIEGQWMPPE